MRQGGGLTRPDEPAAFMGYAWVYAGRDGEGASRFHARISNQAQLSLYRPALTDSVEAAGRVAGQAM